MEKINFNQRAVVLAKELIGKCIVYKGKRYMITVTEAYPYNDDESYIYRYSSGKSHKVLTVADKIGQWFVYGGMLHLACAGGDCNGEYHCDNILIRGAILVVDKKRVEEDCNLNFKIGKPYTLCHDKLGIPSTAFQKELQDDIRLKDFENFEGNIEEDYRIKLNDKSKGKPKLRYFVSKTTLTNH